MQEISLSQKKDSLNEFKALIAQRNQEKEALIQEIRQFNQQIN